MSACDVIGLPVAQAQEILAAQGLKAEMIYTKPPFPAIDTASRTLRVVAMRGEVLVAAFFKDKNPGEKDSACK
ncbi:MAG: hypothetical protein GX540_01960 [Clostridiales bacterium]|nr:hypothetical protein [Clostridiales bacterium]